MAEFDDVNSSWKIIMDPRNKDKNALRGTHHQGNEGLVLEFTTLSDCKKSLYWRKSVHLAEILATPLGRWMKRVQVRKEKKIYFALKKKTEVC